MIRWSGARSSRPHQLASSTRSLWMTSRPPPRLWRLGRAACTSRGQEGTVESAFRPAPTDIGSPNRSRSSMRATGPGRRTITPGRAAWAPRRRSHWPLTSPSVAARPSHGRPLWLQRSTASTWPGGTRTERSECCEPPRTASLARSSSPRPVRSHRRSQGWGGSSLLRGPDGTAMSTSCGSKRVVRLAGPPRPHEREQSSALQPRGRTRSRVDRHRQAYQHRHDQRWFVRSSSTLGGDFRRGTGDLRDWKENRARLDRDGQPRQHRCHRRRHEQIEERAS